MYTEVSSSHKIGILKIPSYYYFHWKSFTNYTEVSSIQGG